MTGAAARQAAAAEAAAEAARVAPDPILRPRSTEARVPREAFAHEPPTTAAEAPQSGTAGPDGRGRGATRGRADRTASAAAAPSLGTARYGAASAARLRRRPAWPSVGERLLLATVAWVPVAITVGAIGRAAAGCDELAGCSPLVEPLIVLGVATALLGFAAFPKLAYLGAVGTVSGFLAILPLLIVASMTGILRDAEPPLVAAAAAITAAAYVIGAWWAWRDGPQPRPWLRPGN